MAVRSYAREIGTATLEMEDCYSRISNHPLLQEICNGRKKGDGIAFYWTMQHYGGEETRNYSI